MSREEIIKGDTQTVKGLDAANKAIEDFVTTQDAGVAGVILSPEELKVVEKAIDGIIDSTKPPDGKKYVGIG